MAMVGKKQHADLFIYQANGRAARPSWLSPEVTRYIPAICCVVIPFIILFMYQRTVAELIHPVSVTTADITGSNCPAPDNQTRPDQQAAEIRNIGIQGGDVSGRFAFTTGSAILRVLAIVGTGFGMFVIWRRASPVVGLLTGVAGLALGYAVFKLLTHHEGTREILVNRIMDAASKADPKLFAQDQSALVDTMVTTNTWYGFTAVVFIFCALGVVAIRAREEELKPAILRQRLFDLRWLLIVAASILVLTVVITHALVDWQLSFLCDAYRDGLKAAGDALANYWGTGSSIVLLGALLPSYFSWSRDVAKWAEKTKGDATEKERNDLIESEELDFAPTASVSAILTLAIPALSGPLLELLKALPGLSSH
jgi:hypothetical protein